MEQTLGKRIAAHRKRIGLTQEALAEQLNVTAQAVSKWENDQSCPDIATLPKLCEIFGISTDELLDHRYAPVHQGEVVDGKDDEENDDEETPGIHIENNGWEFHWDGGRINALTFALFVLLVGVLFLLTKIFAVDLSFWSITWPSAILVFGLRGIFHRFSLFSAACTLFGGYTLANSFGLIHWEIPGGLIFPVLLVLFGINLLIDALRKPKKPSFHIKKRGKNGKKTASHFEEKGECFDCSLSFGEATHMITLPRLSRGKAELSFGEMTVDLTQCEEIAPDCTIQLECCFGELQLLVPKAYRIEPYPKASFGNVEIVGQPAEDPVSTVCIDSSVSFGEITIRYV